MAQRQIVGPGGEIITVDDSIDQTLEQAPQQLRTLAPQPVEEQSKKPSLLRRLGGGSFTLKQSGTTTDQQGGIIPFTAEKKIPRTLSFLPFAIPLARQALAQDAAQQQARVTAAQEAQQVEFRRLQIENEKTDYLIKTASKPLKMNENTVAMINPVSGEFKMYNITKPEEIEGFIKDTLSKIQDPAIRGQAISAANLAISAKGIDGALSVIEKAIGDDNALRRASMATPEKQYIEKKESELGRPLNSEELRKAHEAFVPFGSQKIEFQSSGRSDRSYQFTSGQLDKAQTPIDLTVSRLGRLEDTINENTPQADALVAPELLTVMAGGQGSGLRMNEAEIARIVGGRSNWETLKASVNKWNLDPATAVSITPAQRQQVRSLFRAVQKKLLAKQSALNDARQRLIYSDDPTEHRRILANTRQSLSDIDARSDAPIRYTEGENAWDIPKDEVPGFEKRHPNAKRSL